MRLPSPLKGYFGSRRKMVRRCSQVPMRRIWVRGAGRLEDFLKAGRDLLDRFLRGDHGIYVEHHEVAPASHPGIEERPVMGFHQLIAALELVVDPTRHV